MPVSPASANRQPVNNPTFPLLKMRIKNKALRNQRKAGLRCADIAL
jgi:hypothetical protein